MRNLLLTSLFVALIVSASAHTKEEWKARAIYQLLTDRFATTDGSSPSCNLSQYCGGTFKGIINKLDYIKGMGFDAIWISPVVTNTEGSYHGYHLTNLYTINSHFGTAEELKQLVEEAHKKDIWVMVDVVANHVGPVGTDYSQINPFNLAEHYHDICQITDWTNQDMVENCRLCDLPDLEQENTWVAEKLYAWITDIVKTYNFDGIRIDTIPEVPKWFWTKFAEASGTFQLGEVFNGNPSYVAGYQGHVDSLFNYPLYYTIQDSFCGSMKNIESYWFNTRNIFPEPKVLGVFVENHDNARFLNRCGDHKKFKNAVIFSMMWEGIPVFYYGGEQFFNGGGDPNNREPLWGHYDTASDMYVALKKANEVRVNKKIWTTEVVQRYADDVFYAFTRGDVLVCLTRGESCSRSITYHEFNIGDKLCNALDSNDCVTVDSSKSIAINMGQDPKIYVKQ